MRGLLLLAAVTLMAGCASSPTESGLADGHYARYYWGRSVEQCNNGACTYNSNHETFESHLACDVEPKLSWEASGWKHGSLSVSVLDHGGQQAASHQVTSSGNGSELAHGAAGGWTLQGFTQDANGQVEIRLTCG